MKKKLKIWGRYIRGDYLSSHGKRLVVLAALLPVWVAQLLVDSEALSFVFLALLAGWWIGFWASAKTGCSGEKQILSSPSGEAELAICYGCEAWVLQIRGEERGEGRGAKSLVKRLRDLSKSHERDLPVIAGELAILADGVESTGNLEEDPKLPGVQGRDEKSFPTKTEAEGHMDKIIDRVAKAMDEGKSVAEAIAGSGQFLSESSDGSSLGMGIIVDGDQYKRFQEFIESEGEEVKAFGRMEVRDVSDSLSGTPPKEKKPEPKPENCQDCGQKIGEEHLKTCPYAKEGTVTEKHAQASGAK